MTEEVTVKVSLMNNDDRSKVLLTENAQRELCVGETKLTDLLLKSFDDI